MMPLSQKKLTTHEIYGPITCLRGFFWSHCQHALYKESTQFPQTKTIVLETKIQEIKRVGSPTLKTIKKDDQHISVEGQITIRQAFWMETQYTWIFGQSLKEEVRVRQLKERAYNSLKTSNK